MSKGIYLFWDNKYEQVIYAGRFTGRQRIKDHFKSSKKHKQKINSYVQNHPDRIEPVIFCEFDDISDNDLNQLEKETIKLFKLNKCKYPDSFVFNFTDGGDGNSGYILSKETKKKISEAHTGKTLSEEHRKKISENQPDRSGKNNPMWGKKHTSESRKQMSESHRGDKNHMWGRKHTTETKRKMSENHADVSKENNPRWKDYPRIVLGGKERNGKQRYKITYNGKTFAQSIYKKKLCDKWYTKHPDIELIDETI